MGVYRTAIFYIALHLALSQLYGCGPCPSKDLAKEVIIASIDGYKVTALDFQSESRSRRLDRFAADDQEKIKEYLMDDIITRKVLLQEAQRQRFDREKLFMKEIERFWEQSLLKLLYKKKAQELEKGIVIDDKDIIAEYGRLLDKGEIDPAKEPFEKAASEIKDDMKRSSLEKALGEWVDGLKSKAKIGINRENLKKIVL